MRVADLSVQEAFPGVFHIETPGNIYVTLLVGAQKALLVDTGLGICDLKSVIKRITDLPIVVMNTHGHNDHIGGNYQFDEVLMTAVDMPIARFAMQKTIKDNVVRIREPENVLRGYYEYDLQNVSELSTDAVFDLGGMYAGVIALPNHTPGSVGLFLPKQKLLLGADSVAPFTSLFFPEAVDLPEHIKLLNKLEDCPFEHLLCSHSNKVYTKSYLKVLKECAEHYDEAKTVRYKDAYFSQFVGRMYFYRASTEPDTDNEAVLVLRADKTM